MSNLSAPVREDPVQPGSMMLHYRIDELIGVGGMGEVYRATDTRLGREVALKLLPENLGRDPERRQRFEREARVLASLQHPGIATIHGLEECEGRLILVMELVRGEELKTLMQRGRLPVERAVDIAVRMAEGMEAAHARGIVHRDLKPANVKITPEGRVKILDFGLARAMHEDRVIADDPAASPTMTADMTRDGAIMGTAAYMSPEQARGQEVDARADIWAFGCILFEMLTGRAPYTGDTVSDTLASVLRSEPDWDELPADLPPALPRLLRRCLAKDARGRLHAAADARLELSEWREEPAPASAVPRTRRRGVPAWLALAGWVLAVAGATGWLLRPQADHAPPRFDTLTYSTRDWCPDVSPDGNMVAFASDRDGVSRIWLKQIAGGGEAPLTDGPDDVPRFSPDGAQVLFARDVGATRHLYRTSVVGGQLRKVVENAVEGDWSPDGESVAFIRPSPDSEANRTDLGVVELQSGRERILASVDNRLCYGVRWSPDGRRIAMNEASLTGNVAETSTITFIDMDDGRLERLAPTDWRGPFTALEWMGDGGSILFGQAPDMISHVSGLPCLVMLHDFGRAQTIPLAWRPLRLPKGGWGTSAVVALDDGRLVLDEQLLYADLLAYDVDAGPDAPPRILTRDLGIDRQPVFSPDGGRLLFSSNRSGNVDIWILDLDTGELSQLTDDPAGDWDPAFSPDGTEILWSSDRGGHMEVWKSSLDGSQARQVTNDGVDAENPTMTADGEWIVYASSNDAKQGIWRIRPDGSDAERLAAGAYLLPDTSPDGRYVAFMSMRSLDFVVSTLDLETGEMLPFEIHVSGSQRTENMVLGRARWRHDGRGILYLGQNAEGRSGVFLQLFDPADAGPAQPPVPLAGFDRFFTTESLGLSPDGRTLVISAQHEQRILKLGSGIPLQEWIR